MFKDEVENSRENVRARKKIVKIKRSRNRLRIGSKGRWTKFEMKYEIVPIHNKILTLVELVLCKKIVKMNPELLHKSKFRGPYYSCKNIYLVLSKKI